MRQSLNKYILAATLLIFMCQLQGQVKCNDLDLVRNVSAGVESHSPHEHSISFLLSDHPSAIVRYNPLSLVLGGMLWTYQKIISPQFSANCLYSPSCSAYSKQLISDFGILTGIVLTADRLSRCNRLALMDFKTWEVDYQSGKIIEATMYYRIDE